MEQRAGRKPSRTLLEIIMSNILSGRLSARRIVHLAFSGTNLLPFFADTTGIAEGLRCVRHDRVGVNRLDLPQGVITSQPLSGRFIRGEHPLETKQ